MGVQLLPPLGMIRPGALPVRLAGALGILRILLLDAENQIHVGVGGEPHRLSAEGIYRLGGQEAALGGLVGKLLEIAGGQFVLEHALQLGEVEQVAQGDDVEVDAAGVHPFALALQHVALYVRRRDGRKPSAAEVFDAVVERGTLPGDGEFALGLGGSQPVQIDMAVIIERWRDAGGGCLALLAVLYELALGEHGLGHRLDGCVALVHQGDHRGGLLAGEAEAGIVTAIAFPEAANLVVADVPGKLNNLLNHRQSDAGESDRTIDFIGRLGSSVGRAED